MSFEDYRVNRDPVLKAALDFSDDNEAALFVFEMNANLFPNSANTWDSLAECYLKLNNKEKAVEYYEKALKMNPNGGVGENAKSMLKRIKSM